MSSKDNEHHLKQILYREALERRGPNPQDAAAEADSSASMSFDPLAKWLRVRGRIEHRLDALQKRLSPVHVDVRIAQAKPHTYTPHEYPSIAHLRLALF